MLCWLCICAFCQLLNVLLLLELLVLYFFLVFQCGQWTISQFRRILSSFSFARLTIDIFVFFPLPFRYSFLEPIVKSLLILRGYLSNLLFEGSRLGIMLTDHMG